MTHPVVSSNFSSTASLRRSRGLFTINENIFTVTIQGEEGEFETFEICAASSREASHKALCLTSVVNVLYLDIQSF